MFLKSAWFLLLSHSVVAPSVQSMFGFFLIFWPHRMARVILVPQPGLEPVLPALAERYFNHCSGEGSGTPLQYSCLEGPMDGGAWWAAVFGVAQSRTQLKWLSSSSSNSAHRNILKVILMHSYTSYIPDTVLSTLHVLCHVGLVATRWNKHYNYPLFYSKT